MKQIKVLIVDSEESIKNYEENLKAVEYINIVGTTTNGREAVELAEILNPDVTILDVILPGLDGFEVIEQIRKKGLKTKFIVLSNYNSQSYISKALDLSVSYYLLKPIETFVLAKRIEEVNLTINKQKDVEIKKLDEKITNIFITVGIPAHIKGYYFLREAIKMAVNDPYVINSITKKLYPCIAERFETSSSKVERAIRHAIEVAWNKGKIENINDVFGLKVYDTNEKPTNGEFIALVADKMLLGN